MKVLKRLILAVLVTILLDGLTKNWAEQSLQHYSPVPAIGEFLQLTLTHNNGVAFGMFMNSGPWPSLILGVLILMIVGWLVYAHIIKMLPKAAGWPLGVFLGGRNC
jgi:lipoprotein signal peptidase